MKIRFFKIFFVLLAVFPAIINAQIVTDNSFRMIYPKSEIISEIYYFETGNNILDFSLRQKISGLSISGCITFTGEKGFVRIVLTDDNGFDYLVLETNTIFEYDTNIIFDEFCEETSLLNNVIPKQLTIVCDDAYVVLSEIQWTAEKKHLQGKEKKIKEDRFNAKLQHINSVLAQKEITWGAGKTSLSELSYNEKKNLFGGVLPNLAGFEYYVSGIYIMQGYNPKNNPTSSRNNFVSEFDWRNRHGKNWITPAKNQLPCNSCWVFAPIGAVEAYTNLYFNRLLNLDLSEQEILSCGGGNWICENAGSQTTTLNYIKNSGVVNDMCLPYNTTYPPCSVKCSNPDEKIKIENFWIFNPSITTPDDLKKLIIQYPISYNIKSWRHAVGLVGYKTIQEGDKILLLPDLRTVTITSGDPLIGSDAWIMKNSQGPGWGNNGFAYVVGNWAEVSTVYYIIGKITSLNYTDDDIICEDNDGDGYYYWGIGPKPSTCPCWVPDEPDGDDSDPYLGPMDEYGNCAIITPFSDNITTPQTWDRDATIYKTTTIHLGATLTITSTIKFADNVSIIVQPGGRLVVNGGTLTNACESSLWKGIVVKGTTTTPQNAGTQGSVILTNAKIENAKIAIDAAPSGNPIEGNGGIIQATNTQFINNVQAINYGSYENKNSGGVIIDNMGNFKKCYFSISQGDILVGNIFYNHCKLYKVRGIKFTGCHFYKSEDIIAGRGIFSQDAGFKVTKYCDLVSAITCECHPTDNTPSVFENLFVPINVSNSGNTYDVYIDQCDFQTGGTAVASYTAPNFRFTRNNVSNFTSSTGSLFCLDMSGYKIEQNYFEDNSSSATIGIRIDNSGGSSNLVYRNSFKNLLNGIKIHNNNADPIKGTGLQFKCNNFENCNEDIFLNRDATIASNQGNVNEGADNCFNNTHSSSLNNQNSNLWIEYYRSLVTKPSCTTPINPVGNVTINNANQNQCKSTLCYSLIDTAIISNKGLALYLELQQERDNLLREYEEGNWGYIMENIDNPEFSEELIDEALLLSGRIYKLNDDMYELSDRAIRYIVEDSILNIEMLRAWYGVVHTPITKYYLAESWLLSDDFENADAILRIIPNMFNFNETEMAEYSNYLRFHNFKKQLNLEGRDWADLEDSEISYLQSVAEANTGRSSTMAKGVLCFFFNICYEENFEDFIETLNKNSETINFEPETLNPKPVSEYGLTIYPNPAQTEITVSIGSSKVSIDKVELYDIFGKLLIKQNFYKSNGTIPINKVPDGIYVIKIYLSNGDVENMKVVKQQNGK